MKLSILFIILVFLFSCTKVEQECWQCELRYQHTEILIEESIYCDKDWSDIINIMFDKTEPTITYMHCSKIE